MTHPEPIVRPAAYTVSLLPEGHRDTYLYEIRVEARAQRTGPDLWSAIHCGYALGTDGIWSREPIPSEREDEWLAAHRFDFDTALRLAKEAAPGVTVNGRTAADAWARTQEAAR